MKNLLLIFVICICNHEVFGGFPNVHCPATPGAKVFLPCDQKCREIHGASKGTCQENYNCFCEGKATCGDGRICVAGPNVDLDERRNLCTMDCLCNHGAKGGFCEFTRGACQCVNYGDNLRNEGCTYKDVKQFSRLAYDVLGLEGLGRFAKFFVNGELVI